MNPHRAFLDPALRRWLALALAFLPIFGLAGEGTGGGGAALTVSPLELDSIRRIVPLGNLNPRGGHVLPTDHMYLDYGGVAGLPVRAPGDGTVFAVRPQSKGDYKVEIRVDSHVSVYVAHLFTGNGIEVGRVVKAGEVLGTTSGRSWLDLGAWDSRVRLAGFVNATRYPPSTLQTVSPLRLFVEPLRGLLYAKVRRDGGDKDGRCDLDVPGRLAGNWFLEAGGGESTQTLDATGAQRELAFAYDLEHPREVRISIGGTVAGAGIYATDPGAPDPGTVSPGSGVVRYPLREVGGDTGGASGTGECPELLVRLIDATTLRVACVFSNAPGAGPELLRSNAWTYRR